MGNDSEKTESKENIRDIHNEEVLGLEDLPNALCGTSGATRGEGLSPSSVNISKVKVGDGGNGPKCGVSLQKKNVKVGWAYDETRKEVRKEREIGYLIGTQENCRENSKYGKLHRKILVMLDLKIPL